MSDMETNANQKVSCMVNYVYDASEPDELTIRPGDVLRDVERLPGGWWRGELRGRRGMFPDNFVSVLPDNNNARPGGVQGRCRAVFSYQPANPDELPLCVGDVLEVLGEVEEGWWQGKRQGRVGVFPSNFVVMLDPPASTTPIEPAPALPPKPVKELCRVLFPYSAVNEDELTLAEGDIVTIVSKEAPDRGWWRGEVHGRIGLFPDNFVQMLPIEGKKFHNEKTVTAYEELENCPELPEYIRRKIQKKRQLQKFWQRTRCPKVKTELNTLSAKIKALVSHWRVATGVVEEKKPDRPPSKTAASPVYPVLNKYSEKTASVKELTTSKISTHKENSLSKEINTQTIITNTSKNDSEKLIHSESVTDGAIDGQLKKPPVPLKKSPTPASGVGGLFSGLKSKMLSSTDKEKSQSNTVSSSGSSSSGEWDRIDGGGASKPTISNNTTVTSSTVVANSASTFDHIERNTLLSDPRAGRVKAPRRRPPSQALRDDTPQQIGLTNGHEVPTEKPPPIPVEKSAAAIAAEEIKPRTREWEKHKAPWMAELKLNQAKKTSFGETKSRSVSGSSEAGVASKAGGGSTDRILDVGLEEKRSTHSMEMSKSTSSISSRMSLMESYEETTKVRHSMDSRKDVSPAAREYNSRDSEPIPTKPVLNSPTAAGRTLTSMLEDIKKPAAPSPPLASVRTSAEIPTVPIEKSPNKTDRVAISTEKNAISTEKNAISTEKNAISAEKNAVLSEKSEILTSNVISSSVVSRTAGSLFERSSTLERTEKMEDKPEKNDKSASSTLERRLHFKPERSEGSDALIAQLNNRISNLEKLIEVQNAMFKTAIEDLTTKLKMETEKRQSLQSEVEKLAHCVTQV